MNGPTPSQQRRIDNWSAGDPVQYPEILPDHWISVTPIAGIPPRCSCGVVENGSGNLNRHIEAERQAAS